MLFISHSTQDKTAALDLQRRLRARGYASDQHFLDSDQRSGINLGEKWEKVIYDNLRDCRALIVLCSPNWLRSKWCFAELASAKMSGKKIFPVVLADCDRSALSEYQAVFVNQEKAEDREQAFERLFQDLEAQGLGPKDYLPWPNPELKDVHGQVDDCPFPGLPAFDERYAAVYFGRERETQDILEELRQMRSKGEPRLLMIVGGSGSGKSSLLMAGVLPRLKHPTSHSDWLVLPTVRFGRREGNDALFDTLADDIVARYPPVAAADGAGVPDRKDLRDKFAAGDASQAAKVFLDATRDLAFACGVEAATVLLPVDQFEEFLTPSAGSRADRFLRFLEQVCRHRDDRMLVVGTMRSDYLDIYERHPHALKSPKFHPWRLEPFPRAQIENVVLKPAARVNVEVAPGLLEQLKQDVPTTDALPLLAFTLEKLYRKYAADKKLDLSEYEDLGGLEGSIKQTAEEIMPANSLAPNIESTVRLSFVKHLSQVNDKGEFVRLTARWKDLDSTAHKVLEEFVKQRLLVKTERNREVFIEVAHEAIFRCWEPLAAWLRDSADIARWRRDVDRDQKSATANRRKWSGLTGPQLALARHWPQTRRPELSNDEVKWIQKAVRKSRIFLGIWVAVVVVIAGFAGVAWWQRGVTNDQRSRALYELYAVRASQLEQAWTSGNYDRLSSLLEQAQMIYDNIDLRGFEWFLFNRVANAQVVSVRAETSSPSLSPLGELRTFTLSHDSKSIALGWNNFITVLDYKRFLQNADLLFEELQSLEYEELQQQKVEIEDLVAVLKGARYNALAFSPDDKYLLAAGDHFSEAWKTESWERTTLETKSGGYSISFADDGTLVALGALDNSVKVFRVPEFQLWHSLTAHTDRVTAVDIRVSGPNSAVLASSSIDGTIRVWNVHDERVESVELLHDTFLERKSPVNDVHFSDNGRVLASAGDDSTVKLRFGSGYEDYLPTSQIQHSDEVWSLAFSPDSEKLVSGARNGVVKFSILDTVVEPKAVSTESITNVADLDTEVIGWASGWPEAVVHIEFSRDSKYFVTLSLLGRIRVFDVAKLTVGYTPKWSGHSTSNNDIVRSIRFSSDAKQLFAVEDLMISTAENREGDWTGFSVAGSDTYQVVELASESSSKGIRLLTIEESQKLQDIRNDLKAIRDESASQITSVAFYEDQNLAYLGHQNGQVSIWNLEPVEMKNSFRAHEHSVDDIAYLPNFNMIATCGNSLTIKIWNAEDYSLQKELTGHARRVNCLLSSLDGRRLFSGSDDGTIRIWDLFSGHSLATLRKHASGVTCLAMTRDGLTMASGGRDKNVVFWQGEMD